MSAKICTFLLLLLGLAIPALSGKCPDPERLPTTCECADELLEDGMDIELTCSSATIEELKDALRLMDKESRLEVQLEDMTLGYLPSRLFEGFNVAKIEITHCEMDGLAPVGESPFKGLEETLETLVVISSYAEEGQNALGLWQLSHLTNLGVLDFSYNAIDEIHDRLFSAPPPMLTHLILSNNGIERLGERAFEKLENLIVLELHGNRFGPIKRSMLPRPGHLKKIELDNNALTSLPMDIFMDFTELEEISIRSNGISQLQETTFKYIWPTLQIFDARGNPLECDSSMEWMREIKTKATVLGTCDGPLGREGTDLRDFINRRN